MNEQFKDNEIIYFNPSEFKRTRIPNEFFVNLAGNKRTELSRRIVFGRELNRVGNFV